MELQIFFIEQVTNRFAKKFGNEFIMEISINNGEVLFSNNNESIRQNKI